MAASGFQQTVTAQEKLPTLEEGKIVERQLTGGKTHSYQVSLAAGQYLRVSADQRGIDFEIRIFGPEGQGLIRMDTLNSTQGPEIVSVIAEQSGSYRVEIVSPDTAVPDGRYEVKIEALRAATEQDRKWIVAQLAYAEGGRLRAQQTAETRRQAIQRFEEAARQWRAIGDRLMVAHSLYYLSSCYRFLGQQQQALTHLNQALQLLRDAGERREEAPALTSLGIVYTELGEPRKSLEFYDQALLRWRHAKDVYGEARTLINLGLAYTSLGEARTALENYNQALSVWQKLENRQQAADTLTSIGRAYDILGEWQKAMENYEQALSLYSAMANRRGEASALNNIGIVHGRLGEPHKELEYYNRSLELWRTMGDRREEANTLINIGSAEASLNNPQTALSHYTQALQLWREAGDRRGEAIALQYIGEFHASSADPRKALEYYDQALPLLRTAGDRWREACVLRNLGYLHLRLGESQRAMEYSSQALTLFRSIGDRSGEAQALYGVARAERNRGSLVEARRQIELAITLVEAVRADVRSRQLRASYLASAQKYYEFNIDLLMRLNQARPAEGFDALAVQMSERARARGLIETLTESGARIREGADAALLERERGLSQQLNAKAASMMQLTGHPHKPEQAEALKLEISQLESEYEQAQAAIRRASPHYAAITQPPPLKLTEIQRQLDPDTLLLEYSLGEERSFLWAITNNSLTSYELPKQEQIEEEARRVYDLLTARARSFKGETRTGSRARLARAEAQLPAAAMRLGRTLLAPVAADLGNKRLAIVADGALQYLPFAMLPAPETAELGRDRVKPQTANSNSRSLTPLVVNHEVISLPSASALAALRQELNGRKPAPNNVAVIADPVFAAGDERVKILDMGGSSQKDETKGAPQADAPVASVGNTRIIEHLAEDSGKTKTGKLVIPRLLFTRQEADRIIAVASVALGATNLSALDFKANRAIATGAELGQYRYIHFATHGLLDSERPGLSALVLSLVDEKGKPQDGFLRAHEIYNLNLPAELVVLSACQTGLGKEIKGEGLVGMTRGFMYAGAARVMVSLWNVNDKATAELMAKFYGKMFKEGQRPASALRAAQVEMWRNSQWRSPYFWAAFVLQGEWK